MGTLSEDRVLNKSTASFATGFVVVVTAEVGVTVGLTSSQSYVSHGQPAGQFSLILMSNKGCSKHLKLGGPSIYFQLQD